MYCKNCGAQINDGAVFCEKCGAKQIDQSEADAQKPDTVPQTDEEIIKDFEGNVYAASKYLHLRDGISMKEAKKRIKAVQQFGPTHGNDSANRASIKKPVLIGVTIVFGLFLVFQIINHICFHEWSAATCETPITCVKCGKTKGESLGHDWIDATCTNPSTCSRCKKTSGKALGHDADFKVVQKATCSEEGLEEGYCKRCKETVSNTIDRLPHTPSGKWEITEKATLGSLMGLRVQYCTVCGEVAKEETYTLTEAEKLTALKSACKSYSFKEISRNPDSYSGKYAYFKGEVSQVVQDSSSTQYAMYRVSVTNNGYFWTDAIMVVFEGEMEDGSRLIEDDIVKMYGKLDGMYTYETVMGDSLTIPLFRAQHIERVN